MWFPLGLRSRPPRRIGRFARSVAPAALFLVFAGPLSAGWTASWFTSQQLTEPRNLPPAPGLSHATLRQYFLPTLGGSRMRVQISNAFGLSPLVVSRARIAVAGPNGSIDPSTDRALLFGGREQVMVPPGASFLSDPLDLAIAPLRRMAVTLAIAEAPQTVTGHPGSRTTSYLAPGDEAASATLPSPATAEHWYFLTSLEVWTDSPAAAICALGDSITDGHASITNADNRWPDDLARRLQAEPGDRSVAVLNAGIGGNCLLRGGLGPNALARFDRDVLAPPGVKSLIVLEGINDIGSVLRLGKMGRPYAHAADLILALQQIVARAHAHGIRVFGGTITPYGGCSFYFSPEGEVERQMVNAWIRAPGHFDGVIDFEAAVRDPSDPIRLAPRYDSGDHLHPSPAGYQAMADAIDLAAVAPAHG